MNQSCNEKSTEWRRGEGEGEGERREERGEGREERGEGSGERGEGRGEKGYACDCRPSNQSFGILSSRRKHYISCTSVSPPQGTRGTPTIYN